MSPSDVHPSHDVREEGLLYSDAVCQRCRIVVPSPALRGPCVGSRTLTIDTHSPPGAYAEAIAQRPAQPTLPTFADRQFARSWWDHATPGEKAAMRECVNG